MEEYEGNKLYFEKKELEAEKKCLEDIRNDPTNFIPFCTLLNIYSERYDADSNVLAGRETLHYAHILLKEFFEKPDFDFAEDPKSMQYLTILLTMGKIAQKQSYIHIQAYIYEEILRLNKSNSLNQADILLYIYMEIIGLINGEKKISINRTPEMAESLITTYKLSEESLVVQIWRLLQSYLKPDEDEKDFAEKLKKFEEKYPTFFKILFKEDFEKDKTEFENSEETVELITKLLKVYTQFAVKSHALLRKKSAKFNKSIEDLKKEVFDDRKPDFYTFVYSMFMKNGRQSLHDAQFIESTKMFTLARNVAYETALPKRFYRSEKFEFAILSNRCTGFYQAGYLASARQDAIFTLFVKFDHFKTLDKTAEIAEAFGASQEVIDKLKGWAQESPNVKSGERRRISKRVIPLLTLEGLYRSRTEPAQKIIEDLEPVLIEHFYTSINLPADKHEMLPWLTEADLEPKL